MKKNFLILIIFVLLFDLFYARLIWKKSILTEISGSPAIFEDKIVFASKTGNLFCIDSEGNLSWRRDLKTSVLASPSIDEAGNIYISGLGKKVYCFNMNGEKNWEIELNAGIRATPLILGNTLFVGDEKGTLYAINKKKKKVIWTVDLKSPVFSSPVFNRKKTRIIVPTKNYYLFSVDIRGKIIWKFKVKGVIFSSPAVTLGDDIYLTSMDHHIYKLSPEGKLLWKFKANFWIISSPVVDNKGNVYFGSYDKNFYCLSGKGELKWKYRGKGGFNASPVIDSEGNIYTGDGAGTFYAFNPKGKVIWTHKIGDFVRSGFAVFSPKKILISGALDSGVYAFQIEGKLSKKAWWPKYLGNHRNSGYTD